MAKTPPVPSEQRSFGSDDAAARLQSARPDRRDTKTDAQSAQPGDADVNTDTQGRFGNIAQNTQPLDKVQDR